MCRFAGNKVCLRDVAQRFRVCLATIFRQNDKIMDFLYMDFIVGNIIKFGNKENTVNELFQVCKSVNCI